MSEKPDNQTEPTDDRGELMSRLADGELESDRANRLLLEVLEDPQDRRRLKDVLQMRQSLAAWRSRRPEGPMLVLHDRPAAPRRLAWLAGGLAVAAMFGAIMVTAGFYLARRGSQPAGRPYLARAVTPEQMRQVATVFALHESVAGPLRWYASDEEHIQVSSAAPTEATNQPVAVMLRLTDALKAAKTYLIVCRENEPSVIDLPSPVPEAAGLRVCLTPSIAGGKLKMQYVIALAGGGKNGGLLASLSGQRGLGLAQAPLGRLAAGEKLIDVEAAAWTVRPEDALDAAMQHVLDRQEGQSQ